MDPLSPLNHIPPDDPVAGLMATLQQMKALQTQPIIPNNQLAQMGSIMTSFNAGLTGKPDPLYESFRRDREGQLKNLHEQAGISGTLASLQNTQATREMAMKKYDLDLFQTLSKSEDFNTRISGFKAGVRAGILPQDLDVNMAATKGGKEYQQGHDQVIALIQAGVQDPTTDPKYMAMFPKDIFGPVVAQAQQAMTMGPVALNQMKLKPDQPENVMKIEVARLGMIPKRSEEEDRQLAAYSHALKLDKEGSGTTVERFAKQLAQEDMQAGRPPRPPSAYLEEANERLKDRDSTIQQIRKAIKTEGKHGPEGSPSFERQILVELTALAGARAASTQDATRLPEKERNMLQILDTARDFSINKLLTEFTPQERLQYAGWFNFKGRQLTQTIQANPKFARFRSYVMQGKSMAFSDGGKNLTQFEGGITFGWVPTGDELSAVDFEEKLKIAAERLDYVRGRIIHYSITPTSDITRTMKNTLTGPPPAPTSPKGQPFRFIKQPDGSVRVVPN